MAANTPGKIMPTENHSREGKLLSMRKGCRERREDMTAKEAFEDVIDFCEKQETYYQGRDPMTVGIVKGIRLVKAATERKREREEREEEEHVQS